MERGRGWGGWVGNEEVMGKRWNGGGVVGCAV